MDFSKHKVDKDIIDKFVSKIVPMGNNHFCWYMNLDEKNSSAFNIGIEGSKKQAVISIDEEGTGSPVHNINSNDTQIVYINDKKSFTSAILHRQLLEAGMRSNFYFCFTINYEQAKAFRNANGQYLRQSQWEDITVEVIF